MAACVMLTAIVVVCAYNVHIEKEKESVTKTK